MVTSTPGAANTDRCLAWAPRVGGAVFAAIIAAVGIVSYRHGAPTPATEIALVMHLLLAGSVLLLVGWCWHREGTGGIVMTLFWMFYLWTHGETVPWPDSTLITGALAVLGLLYFWNAERHRHLPPPPARVSGRYSARTSDSFAIMPEVPVARASGAHAQHLAPHRH